MSPGHKYQGKLVFLNTNPTEGDGKRNRNVRSESERLPTQGDNFPLRIYAVKENGCRERVDGRADEDTQKRAQKSCIDVVERGG